MVSLIHMSRADLNAELACNKQLSLSVYWQESIYTHSKMQR